MTKNKSNLLIIKLLIIVFLSIPIYFLINKKDINTKTSNLTLCAQNLYNLGKNFRDPEFRLQTKAISNRISTVDCDVVALQEVFGRSREIAERTIQVLIKTLQDEFDLTYESYIADTNHNLLRNGFLIKKDLAKNIQLDSLNTIPLLKYNVEQVDSLFERGPARLNFSYQLNSNKQYTFSITTFHFKSRTHGYLDKTGFYFESDRLAMAETLRNLTEVDKADFVFLIGDRNSKPQTASAKVLEGALKLESFANGDCIITNAGYSYECQDLFLKQGNFIPLFYSEYQDEIDQATMGTSSFNGEKRLLDEILIRRDGLNILNKHDYSLGLFEEYSEASDHAMTFIKIKFKH